MTAAAAARNYVLPFFPYKVGKLLSGRGLRNFRPRTWETAELTSIQSNFFLCQSVVLSVARQKKCVVYFFARRSMGKRIKCRPSAYMAGRAVNVFLCRRKSADRVKGVGVGAKIRHLETSFV